MTSMLQRLSSSSEDFSTFFGSSRRRQGRLAAMKLGRNAFGYKYRWSRIHSISIAFIPLIILATSHLGATWAPGLPKRRRKTITCALWCWFAAFCKFVSVSLSFFNTHKKKFSGSSSSLAAMAQSRARAPKGGWKAQISWEPRQTVDVGPHRTPITMGQDGYGLYPQYA